MSRMLDLILVSSLLALFSSDVQDLPALSNLQSSPISSWCAIFAGWDFIAAHMATVFATALCM